MVFTQSVVNFDKYLLKDGKHYLTKLDLCNLFQQCIAYSYNGVECIGICQSIHMEIGFSPKISIYSIQMIEVFRSEDISNFDWIKAKSEKSILESSKD